MVAHSVNILKPLNRHFMIYKVYLSEVALKSEHLLLVKLSVFSYAIRHLHFFRDSIPIHYPFLLLEAYNFLYYSGELHITEFSISTTFKCAFHGITYTYTAVQ